MTWFGSFYGTTLGKKAVMAVSGIVFWGFVVAHMIGNLKILAGAEGFDGYADWLRTIGYPGLPHSGVLWILRVVLIAALVLHVHAAWALTLVNRRARRHGYAKREVQDAGFAARTMRWSGVALLLFVVYHIVHFTTGQAHHDFRAPVETADGLRHFAYHNVTSAFEIGWVALLYVVAMVFLGMHLYHGLWSMFQSLGWNHPRFNHWRRAFAVTFAVVISLGFILVPVAIWTGLIG